MITSLETKVAYLRELGVNRAEHSTDNLLNHLIGTRAILKQWGASDILCDAALFHSIYGTDTYLKATLPVARRHEVTALIGSEAEHLVFLFCTKDRASYLEAVDALPADSFIQNRLAGGTIRISAKDLIDIVQIEAANALEQWSRLPSINKSRAAPMLRCIQPHVVSEDGRTRIGIALQEVADPGDSAA